MAPRPSLARSSTSTRTLSLSRPLSAQSTHSTDSNATQPLATAPIQQQQQQQHSLVPPHIWSQHQQHPMQFQQPLMGQNPHHLAMLDTSITHYQQPLSYAQANFSFDRLQSPAVSSVEGDFGSTVDTPAETDVPKKKGSGASQANDQELRRLFRENEGRNLPEVAGEVKREEKGPKAEKSKQVFGMLWLSQNIKKSTQSVPRNRVYSSYATRCGDDSLPLLNPASFGKLVRIIFPNVQTRRLGVRGESKYHYVNLSLVNDDGRGSVPPPIATNARDVPRPSALSIQPQLSAASDKAFFPNFDSPVKPTRSVPQTINSGATSLYMQHNPVPSARISIPTRKDIMGRTLRWPDPNHQVDVHSPLELPRIDQYLPPGTDLDAANSLAAVYRSHCQQAVDNFRYCKTEAFQDCFKSLVGLLTVPSQKLLGHPQLASWIEACDKLKYQKMMPLLKNILLTIVPETAMTHMERVANGMCAWVAQFFANQPRHVVEAMLRPASAFVSILSRFIRVNRAAHQLSAILLDVKNRDNLWTQWVLGSQPLQVVEGTCDPMTGGHHRLLSLLTHEVGFLLSPTEESPQAMMGLFSTGPWEGKQPPGYLRFKASEEGLVNNGMGDGVLGRFARLLDDIPARFPGVPARDFLSRMETVLGIAGRNMAVNFKGVDLTHFWSVNLFISEMLYWQAEVGGFLELPAIKSAPANTSYTSPYANVNGISGGQHIQPQTRPTNSSGSDLMQQQGNANGEQSKQMQVKLMRLEETFPAPLDSSGSKARQSLGNQSLGGETAVGEDDFPQLDGSIDWSFDKMDTSHLFSQDPPEPAGVAVR